MEQRIKAHVTIVFMGLMCVRYLIYNISLQQRRLSL